MQPIRRRLRRAIVGVFHFCLSIWLCSDLTTQGPGIPKLVYPQADQFKIISTLGTGNHGHAILHNGYVGVLRSGSGVDFYDLSNPYQPSLVQSITTGMGLSEPHTYSQTTGPDGQHTILMRGSGLGGKGFGIWDWTDIFAPKRLSAYDLPGVPGGYKTGVFWLFVQDPYIYCPVGSLGLIIVDATDPTNPRVVIQIPKSQLGGFNTVVAFAIGNMLILTNSDGGQGFARLDISDPVRPVLLHSSPTTPIPYGAQVNGGRLLIPAVSGCAQCTGGGNGSFSVHEIGAQGFTQLSSIALPSRGASAVVQDQVVHIAASRAYLKVDMRTATPKIIGSTPNPNGTGDFDWVTPLGNLVLVGDDQGFGSQVIPHDRLPDITGPTVTMVVPADGALNRSLTSRIGLTLSDMIDLPSISMASFVVRPVGGKPLGGSYSSQFGIVNFTPAEPLKANTTYEVIVRAGGLRDWSGNSTPTPFVSRFSTGSSLNAIQVTAKTNAPTRPGQSLTFDVASATGPGTFIYSWNFGDGTPTTIPSKSSQQTHTYLRPGHYSALVSVSNGSVTGSDSFIQTVHVPVMPVPSTHSSTVILDEQSRRLWCVNADNDSVTCIDTQTMQPFFEVATGQHPRTLALAPDGSIWVVCQDDATVDIFDGAAGGLGQHLNTIDLPYASAPFGIAMSPDGRAAYVSLRATGEVAKLDPTTHRLVSTARVGPDPRGIAVTSDSERVFVSRFISAPAYATIRTAGLPGSDVRDPDLRGPTAEVYELATDKFSFTQLLPLALDTGPDTETSSRGLPNYLGALAISPDGNRLWVPSKKDNIQRGKGRDGKALTFESTVRTIASQIDLMTGREVIDARIDFNDREMACAVAFSPLGDYAFVALQGSNAVEVRDAYTGEHVAVVDGTGLAPQGLAMTRDGGHLFVHNFMSRTITKYDVSGITASTVFEFNLLAGTKTVNRETLSAQVLHGKQIFYNAADPRMSKDGYLSCATCHQDGGHDGRVWDFTGRGEGLRNTISLIGKGGTRHGRVHWTANFDEIQDFENDIRAGFGGEGFMSNQAFNGGTVSRPLGQPKAGISPELDALAAYVSSLTSFGKSPHRMPNGTLSQAGQRGRATFRRLACATCHAGQNFTDSAQGLIHDVGTIKPGSGSAMGGKLLGLDTPTLRGLWASAPYLHDGSANTLLQVVRTLRASGRHGGMSRLRLREQVDLVEYLLQIDDFEPPAQ